MQLTRFRGQLSLIMLVMVVSLATYAALAFWTGAANATPAYARRYGVECTTCHSPNPARLNNVGMVFRRSGFRLPDADESGKFVLKTVPAHSIGDAMAVAGQMDFTHLQNASAPESKSSAQVSEVELIAGTSVGERYSAQVLFVPYTDVGTAELENAEFQMNYGKPESQVIVRAGRAQSLLWQKGGHGSMTQSSPLILDEASAAPIGSFAGPGLGTMLPLIEVGYMATKLDKGKITSGMVSVALTNGFTGEGSSARTHAGDGVDVLAQATALFGSRNTANAFYYDGHTAYDIADPAAVGTTRDKFNRYGVTGNYAPVDQLDLAGGFAGGQDKSDELAATIKTSGYYLEATGQIMPHWVACYRYDTLDPDTGTSGDDIKANTLGTTYLLDSTVFLSAEYRQAEQGTSKVHGVTARIRFLY